MSERGEQFRTDQLLADAGLTQREVSIFDAEEDLRLRSEEEEFFKYHLVVRDDDSLQEQQLDTAMPQEFFGAMLACNTLFDTPGFAWSRETDEIFMGEIIKEFLADKRIKELKKGKFGGAGTIFNDICLLNLVSAIEVTLPLVFPVYNFKVLFRGLNSFEKNK